MSRLGQKVRWKSQAGGTWKVKLGTVVCVVPAGMHWRDAWDGLPPWEQQKYAGAGGFSAIARPEESYLVAVPSASEKAKPKLYWPRTPQLEFLEGDAHAESET